MRWIKMIGIGCTLFCATHAMAERAWAQTAVLELFTSQGCSSCPPADALLHQLVTEKSASYVEDPPVIIALSYHVDYWDRLGWKDPFSLPESTQRQSAYAAHFGQNQVFTPQLVVNGETSVVGSNEREVRAAIAKAESKPLPVRLLLSTHPSSTQPSKTGTLALTIDSATEFSGFTSLIAVHFTPQATTEVKAGENNGRRLISVNNVTEIAMLGEWNGKRTVLSVPNVKPAEGMVILLQDNQTGHILGATPAYMK